MVVLYSIKKYFNLNIYSKLLNYQQYMYFEDEQKNYISFFFSLFLKLNIKRAVLFLTKILFLFFFLYFVCQFMFYDFGHEINESASK
jgi:hypothetical protein